MNRHILSIISAAALCTAPCLAGLQTASAGPDTLSGTVERVGYDIVIIGGTPGGIMTAIAAAREGKDCIILERSGHIGGLPSNGLGATDIGTRGATTGLFTRFIELNRQYYADKYGPDSEQVRKCSEGYHFEPGVAEHDIRGRSGQHRSEDYAPV